MPPRPARRKHLRIEALVSRKFLADVGQLLLNALELNVRTGAGGGVRKSKAGAGWLRAYLCRLVAVAVADLADEVVEPAGNRDRRHGELLMPLTGRPF